MHTRSVLLISNISVAVQMSYCGILNLRGNRFANTISALLILMGSPQAPPEFLHVSSCTDAPSSGSPQGYHNVHQQFAASVAPKPH